MRAGRWLSQGYRALVSRAGGQPAAAATTKRGAGEVGMGVGGSKSKTAKAAEEGGGSAPRAALEAPAAKYAKMPAAAAAVAADRELPEEGHGFEYDLIVIGGGSGGLAASKQAAKYGKKVAVLDFVTPTPQGNAWGLGGTCVNVGCIPKKLMHQAGILGEGMADARSMGWKVGKNVEHDWETLVSSVQDHIGGLNWGYRVALRDASVEYINARGKFVGPHEIECTNRKGTTRTITARRILIAVGGRPSYLGVPGDKECCITSDDVFSLPTSPGKTLIIGGSYIALETAGLLTALGLDVTVVVRSIFLRGFDQEVSEQIVKYMENHGTKFIRRAVPTKFEKTEEGKVKATLHNLDMGFDSDSDYDTVMLAVGRQALTKELGLETCGVETVEKNGKIDAPSEQTNVPHIYAIGDVLESRQELTPVAIKAGVLLAKRLYNGGTISMEYDTVPTTVFTPLEYGTIGISEEDAVKKYGADNVEVYIQYFKPLEWSTNHEEHEGKPHREDSACMSKLVCNLADDERVVGFHYLGPNAAEVTQGFAVGMKMGATKADFDRTVGIHPSTSETFTTLDVTKRSGKDPKAKGC